MACKGHGTHACGRRFDAGISRETGRRRGRRSILVPRIGGRGPQTQGRNPRGLVARSSVESYGRAPWREMMRMLWHSEEKLSRLQRWILVEAYCEIVEAGSNEPKKYRRIGDLPAVHLLRIYVLRNYFNIPVRTQRNDYGHKWLVIDRATIGAEKANAARTSLSRSLR